MAVMPDLKELCRALFQELLSSHLNESKSVVICDQCALRVLNSVCRLSDLYELGVTAVEALERPNREQIPSLHALYLLDPTDPDAVKRIKEDFSGGRVQHEDVHLVFTQPCPPDVLSSHFSSDKDLAPHIRSVREIPFGQFVVLRRNVFHLDLSGGLRNPQLLGGEDHITSTHVNAEQNVSLSGGAEIGGTTSGAGGEAAYRAQPSERSLSLLPGVSQFYPRFPSSWRFPDTVTGLASVVSLIQTLRMTRARKEHGGPRHRRSRGGGGGTSSSVNSEILVRYQADSVDQMCEYVARRLIRDINQRSRSSASDHFGGGASGPGSPAAANSPFYPTSDFSDVGAPASGGSNANPPPIECIILERGYDLSACFVHEYTYEALVYDVLDDTGGGVAINSASTAVVHMMNKITPSRYNLNVETGVMQNAHVLNDDLWQELRHHHFVDAQSHVFSEAGKLSEQFSGLSQLESAKNQTRGNQNPSQSFSTELLAQMVRERPQYQELLRKYHFHVDLFEKAAAQLNVDRLLNTYGASGGAPPGGQDIGELCVFEQDLATGVDREGREMKPVRYVSLLTQVFHQLGGVVPTEVKLRLLLLYFSCILNVPDSSRRQLLEAARLSDDEERVILNMLEMLPANPSGGRGGVGGSSGGANSGAAAGVMGMSGAAAGGGGSSFMSRAMMSGGSAGSKSATPAHRSTAKELKKYKQIAKTARFDMTRFVPKVKECCECVLTNGNTESCGLVTISSSSSGGGGGRMNLDNPFGGGGGSGPKSNSKANTAFATAAALDQVDLTTWENNAAAGTQPANHVHQATMKTVTIDPAVTKQDSPPQSPASRASSSQHSSSPRRGQSSLKAGSKSPRRLAGSEDAQNFERLMQGADHTITELLTGPTLKAAPPGVMLGHASPQQGARSDHGGAGILDHEQLPGSPLAASSNASISELGSYPTTPTGAGGGEGNKHQQQVLINSVKMPTSPTVDMNPKYDYRNLKLDNSSFVPPQVCFNFYHGSDPTKKVFHYIFDLEKEVLTRLDDLKKGDTRELTAREKRNNKRFAELSNKMSRQLDTIDKNKEALKKVLTESDEERMAKEDVKSKEELEMEYERRPAAK
eukprot:g6449.t1